jgi:hypothetical protein
MADQHTRLELTRAEAEKAVARAPAGTRFNLHVRIDAPIQNEENRYFERGICAGLSISRNDALKIIRDGLSDVLEARGARIPLSIHTYDLCGKARVSYWIG